LIIAIGPKVIPMKVGSAGELLRAITEGVNKNGDALFPFHPYTLYGKKI